MAKTMLIADDLTGTLDSGVCLLAQGAHVLVDDSSMDGAFASTDGALCVNTASRHMAPAEAAEHVYALVSAAKKAGVRRIVKKTDSALRGNIGAELAAALKASGEPRLHFIPALPAMGRVTCGGVHYVDGVPVSESVFGRDPFEPVTVSDVREVIALQSEVPTMLVRSGEPVPCDFEGIVVYDAQTDGDVASRIQQIDAARDAGVLAGCAGLASSLASMEADKAADQATPAFTGNLLVVCGSVNDVSRRQCDLAEESGARVFHIAETEKSDDAWLCGDDGRAFVAAVNASWAANPLTVVNGSGLEDLSSLIPEGADVRQVVSDHIGGLLAAICAAGVRGRALVTGGDVLTSFLAQAKVAELSPLGQVSDGVVAFKVGLGADDLVIASKSGGFGNDELLVQMAQLGTK
ncbi:four-carbon acid sugar kinase family protein [Paratractidigestivibacter sp.]|uniref:four-carbon acid sugar kinase family protein n=1 Tax=Paratractidigestivibacter sp. TaxID=2847316 RepID=UPI002ABE1164|nr:four-carbon acid sugar kinase family protein [Paratractidigestivibacter sp.]